MQQQQQHISVGLCFSLSFFLSSLRFSFARSLSLRFWCKFMFAFVPSIHSSISVCFGILVFFYFYFDVSITFLVSSSIWSYAFLWHIKPYGFDLPFYIFSSCFQCTLSAIFIFFGFFFFLAQYHVPFMHLLFYLEYCTLHSSMPPWNIHSVSVVFFFQILYIFVFYHSIADVYIYVFVRICVCESAVVWEMGNISWKTITKTRYERRFIKKTNRKKNKHFWQNDERKKMNRAHKT